VHHLIAAKLGPATADLRVSLDKLANWLAGRLDWQGGDRLEQLVGQIIDRALPRYEQETTEAEA
jgi:hypothetical protein